MSFLTRKLGPFPVWAYAIFAGAVVFVLIRSKSSSSAAAPVQDGTATPNLVGNDSSTTGDDASQDASGISPDVLLGLLGPNSQLAQLLNEIYSGSSPTQTTGVGSSTTTGSPNGTSTSPDLQQQTTGFTTQPLQTTAATGFSTATSPQTGLGPGAVDVGGGNPSSMPGSSISTPVAFAPPAPAPQHGQVLTG